MFQERFYDDLRKFQGCFKKVSRVFQGRSKGVSMSQWNLKVFKRSTMGVSGEFQMSFKDISRKIEEYFQRPSMGTQGSFKGI